MKDPKDMKLGEIVDRMITIQIELYRKLDSARSSSEESVHRDIAFRNYHEVYDPLVEELNERDYEVTNTRFE